MSTRLDDIRRAFEDGECIQTDDARWLIAQAAELERIKQEALKAALNGGCISIGYSVPGYVEIAGVRHDPH